MTDDDVTRTEGEGATVDLPGGVGGIAPGQVLGERYQVLELLGRGGMGEVWHAFDLKLRVEVALKALREDLFKSERRLEMLRDEVRAAREVVSPNVCRIFDLIEIDGQELVSMEYVDGATLLTVLQERGPLELKEAQDIASQFLAGLEAIHKTGLIHRDIKPENIMITRAGRVVVMDFGLARQETEGGGSVSGTPAYMAPEQAAGQALDARADVYAAGVVLAEMVCLDGIKDVTSRQSVWEAVRSEPAKVPETPWAEIIQKAVAKDRERRFNTAHTLVRALEDVTLRVEGAEDLHPYPGLASFTEADAEYFFGREAEVERMWRKLEGPPRMLGIMGPSGAGKSSFIAAGVAANAPKTWQMLRTTPGNAAIASLASNAAREMAGDPDAVALLPRFNDPDVAVELISRWAGRSPHSLLVVDQFEELFTLNSSNEHILFAQMLQRFVLEADVHVLLSMRDDFAASCNAHESLRPIFQDLTVLDPPTGANLRRAIVQPAQKCGYRFEDDALVDQMLAEVEGERGALPLLAFAAARLWEKRDRETGLLTRQAYQDIGGVGGALARHAEATIDQIGHERLRIVRELFRNLVTAEGTRAVRDWDELLSVFCDSSDESPEEVLRQLIDARLLTSYEVKEEDHEPTRRVEIIHESLLANWPRLVRWQTQDQEGAQIRDELRQAARTWKEHDRHDDRLWTGLAYREFELWSERYSGGLSELESEFASAMRTFASRQRRRRRLAIVSAGAVLVAVLAVVTGLWRQSVHQTRVAEGSKLITLGHVAIDESRTDALAYALAALEQADTTEARHLAVEALWAGPPATVLSARAGTTDLAFSPDGQYLAVGSTGGTLTVHSRNGEVVFEQVDNIEMAFPVVGFSPDGRHLAVSPFVGAAVSLRESGSWGESATLRVPDARFGVGFFDADPRRVSTVAYRWRGGAAPSVSPHQFVVDRWSLQGDLLQHVGSLDLPAPPSTPGQAIVDGPLGLIATAIGTDVRVHTIDSIGLAPPRVLLRRPEALRRVSMAFTPDGKRLALCESDGRLSMLATAEPGDPVVIEPPIGDPMATAFSPDGSMLAQALDPSGAVMWNFEGASGPGPLVMRRGTTTAVEFSPDGRWLATASADGVEIFPIARNFVRILDGHDGPATDIEFAGDGSVLYTQGATDGRVLAWPLTGGDPQGASVVLQTGPSYGLGVAADPSARFVIVATEEGLWSVPTGGGPAEAIDFRNLAGRFMVSPQISASGRYVAGVAGHNTPVVWVADLESDRRWAVAFPGDARAMVSLFDREERLVVTQQNGIINRWDPRTEDTETLIENVQAGGIPWPDGRLLVIQNNTRWLVDLGGGSRTEFRLLGGPGHWHFEELPAGLVFARGTRDGSVLVWSDPAAFPHILVGHDVISRVRVSPDGRWIATLGEDGSVRLWPMPDLSKTPLASLHHDELIAKLKSLTNIRAVPDETSYSGYRIEADFSTPHGWAEISTW